MIILKNANQSCLNLLLQIEPLQPDYADDQTIPISQGERRGKAHRSRVCVHNYGFEFNVVFVMQYGTCEIIHVVCTLGWRRAGG